jgi:hypothetical protein
MLFKVTKLDDKPDYTKAFIAAAIGGLFIMGAIFCLPSIIFAPQ